MVRRNDDHVILSEEQLILLDLLKSCPAYDFELSNRFGDDVISMMRDLRTNDHPIHSVGARCKSYPGARIHYYEKPGSELALCIQCKGKGKTNGPFCSGDCQLSWEEERLSDLSKGYTLQGIERDRRNAKVPERYREMLGDYSIHEEDSPPPRAFCPERLSTAIPPHIIGHLAKKARIRDSVSRYKVSVMVRVAQQLYDGRIVSEGDLNELDLALAECLDSGIIGAECHESHCGMCRYLMRDLDHLQELRNRRGGTPAVDRADGSSHYTPRTKPQSMGSHGGSSLFPPRPCEKSTADQGSRWTRWFIRKRR